MPIPEKINEAWFSFLDALEEKGLPFRSIADSLEAKGIPSLPATIAFAAAVIALLYVFLIAPAIAPPTAEVVVFAKTAEGNLVDNATIRIFFEEPCEGAAEKTTYEGRAAFEKMPAPCAVKITAAHYDYETPEAQAAVLQPKEEKNVFFTLNPRIPATVSLAVNIVGPSKARVYLADAAGKEVAVKEGTTLYFEVSPNATYKLRAEASGYRSESKDVVVAAGSPVETLALFELGAAKEGILRITVADSEGKYGRPLPNATVQIFDASTNRVAKNLLTGANGETEPQRIQVGKKIYVLATAANFLPRKSDVFEVKVGENPLRLNLVPSTRDNTYEVLVKVLDESRKAITSPTVRLWKAGARAQELTPSDGVARFKVPAGERFLATAYKQGYLPNYAGEVSRGEYEIVLEKATAFNAGRAKVRVRDAEDSDVAGADVALYRVEVLANRTSLAPLGLLEKQTTLSGYAVFEDVPLGLVAAKAALAGRKGESTPTRVTTEGTPGENATLIEVKLDPGKGIILVLARDRFTGKPLDGATARAQGLVGANEGSSSECTTKAGKCSLELIEGNAEVLVSAPGYDPYSTKVLVIPGEQALEANLVSTEAARTTKLDFLGVYDLRGRKVASLDPATTYVAKYVLRSPPFEFKSAAALVSIGGFDRALADEAASITGWNAPGARVYAGASFEAAQPPAPELPPAPAAAFAGAAGVAQAASNAQENKWAYFEFPSFTGSKEIAVQFKTKAAAKASVELMHRAAWFDAEVIRDPPDKEAGATKPELLANLASSASYEIEFEGACDSDLCVQAWIESGGSTYSAKEGFEALVPEEFKLAFKVLSPMKAATVKLSTPSRAIELKGGASGARTAAVTASEASQDASLEVAITPPAGVGSGYFAAAAKASSKDVPMTLTAETKEGGRVEYLASMRVVHPKPKLVVTVAPKEILALTPTKVVFRVRDAFDNPVENAHVTLGSSEDALGAAYEAFNTEEMTQPKTTWIKSNRGVYVIENAEAKKTGVAKYVVEAEGFKLAKGELPVVATKLFEITPEKITLYADSKLHSAAQLTVRNLLEQEVFVTLSIAKNSIPKYTTVDVDATSVRLKALESKAINFRAKVSDSVLDVAAKATQLKETLDGFVRASARIGLAAGAGRQEAEVPYSVATAFTQRALNEMWALSTESVAIRLEPPAIPFRTEKIVVYNDAPNPILINQMSTLPHVVAEPLSMSIPPGESAELTLHFSALPEYMEQGKCIMEDKRFDLPGLVLAASYQGVVSKRRIRTVVDIVSSENCRPARPVTVALPANVLFAFPAGTKVKRNTDGSTAVLVAAERGGAREEQRMLLHPGATVTESYASVPAGVGIEVTQSLASYDGERDQWTFSFPAQAHIVFGAEVALPSALAANTRIIVGNQQLILPAGATVSKGAPAVLAAPPKPSPQAYAYPGWIPPVPTQVHYPYGMAGAATPVPGVPAYVSYAAYPPYAQPAASMGYLYGSPYSTYDPQRYGFPPAWEAAYSYAKQPGAKYATIPAYARISLRRLEFSSEDESSLTLPAGLALALPSDAVVAKDEYDQSYLVSFANGDVLKSSQTSSYDKATRTLKIPAGTEWHAPKRWILRGEELKKELKEVALVAGEEAFALKLPVDARVSYPSAVADPYYEAGLWILNIEEKRKAIAFTFEAKPVAVGAVKEIVVEKGRPIIALYGASVKAFLLGEALVDAPEKIVVPGGFEHLIVRLPDKTRFEPDSGEARTAILPDCLRVDILFKDGGLFKRLPAVRKIGFEKADFSDRTRVKVAANNGFTPFLCSAASEEERVQTICFKDPVVIGASFNATKGEAGDYNTIAMPACEGVKIVLNVGKPESAIAFGTTKMKAPKEISDVYVNASLGLMMLALKKRGCVDFYVCKDYGKEAVAKGPAVWAGSGIFGFVNASLPIVELNNEMHSKKINFQFYNLAKSAVTLASAPVTRVTPGDYNDAISPSSIVPSQTWSLFFKEGLVIPPATAGGMYEGTATVGVPSALLDAKGCVKSDAAFNAEVEFTAQEPGATVPYKARLSIPVKVSKTGKCEWEYLDSAAGTLAGVFVSNNLNLTDERLAQRKGKGPMVLAFKGIGRQHARPLVVANNLLEDASVQLKLPAGITCEEPLSRKKTTEFFLESAGVGTLFCYPDEKLEFPAASKLGEKTKFTIETIATGKTSGENTTSRIRVWVYNSKGMEAFYSSSPWGEAAPTGVLVPTTPIGEDEDAELMAEAEAAPTVVGGNGTFMQCQKNYCTLDQAKEAIGDFAKQFLDFMNKTVATPALANKYCNFLASKGKRAVEKSTVLNILNFRRPPDLGDIFENAAKSKAGFKDATVTGAGAIKGCGIYRVTAQLELACPAVKPEEMQARLQRNIVMRVEPLTYCAQTPGNAMLLLPWDNTEVIAGREVADWALFSEMGASLKSVLPGGRPFFKPHLGIWTTRDDPKDEAVAASLSSLWGANLSKTSAKYWTDASALGYCGMSFLYPSMQIVTSGAAALATLGVAEMLAAPGTGGVSAVFATAKAYLHFKTWHALIGCGGGAVGALVQKRGTCGAISECIHFALAAGIKIGYAPPSTVNKQAQNPERLSKVLQLPSPDPAWYLREDAKEAEKLVAYIDASARKAEELLSKDPAQAREIMENVREIMQKLHDLASASAEKDLFKSAPGASQAFNELAKKTSDAMYFFDQQLRSSPGNPYVEAKAAIDGVLRGAGGTGELAGAAASFMYSITNLAKIAKNLGTPVEAALKLSRTMRKVDAGSASSTAMTAGQHARLILKGLGNVPKMALGAVSKLLTTIGPNLLIAFLLNFDLSPARAELNASKAGHIIVYHAEELGLMPKAWLPQVAPLRFGTIAAACELDAKGNCPSGALLTSPFGVAVDCPRDNALCLRLVPTKEGGATLIVAYDKTKENDVGTMLNSLLIPHKRPRELQVGKTKAFATYTESLAAIKLVEEKDDVKKITDFIQTTLNKAPEEAKKVEEKLKEGEVPE